MDDGGFRAVVEAGAGAVRVDVVDVVGGRVGGVECLEDGTAQSVAFGMGVVG